MRHFGLGLAMTGYAATPRRGIGGQGRRPDLRHLFDYTVLLSTDAFCPGVSAGEEFQRPMTTANTTICWAHMRGRERRGLTRRSVLSVAHSLRADANQPLRETASIGMNVASRPWRAASSALT